MKSIQKAALFFSFSFLIISCDGDKKSDSSSTDKNKKSRSSTSTSSSNQHVDALCSCLEGTEIIDILKNSKINDPDDLDKAMEDATKSIDGDKDKQKEIATCILKEFKEMKDEFSELNKTDKIEYIKDLIISVVENECLSFAYRLIPFDMVERGLEDAIRDMERGINREFNNSSTGRDSYGDSPALKRERSYYEDDRDYNGGYQSTEEAAPKYDGYDDYNDYEGYSE